MTQGHRPALAAVALATCFLLLTTACGGEEARKDTSFPGIATVDMSNYLFAPTVLEVKAGETAHFLASGDGLRHTFTVPSLGVDIPIPGTKTTTLIEFAVPSGTTGDLELVCYYHKAVGMVGTIRVK